MEFLSTFIKNIGFGLLFLSMIAFALVICIGPAILIAGLFPPFPFGIPLIFGYVFLVVVAIGTYFEIYG